MVVGGGGCLALLGPPRHGAGLGGEADWCGLFRPLRAVVGGVVFPLRAGVGFVTRLGLLAQRQQLFHRLGTSSTYSTKTYKLRVYKKKQSKTIMEFII
jgi:hypothetical protein